MSASLPPGSPPSPVRPPRARPIEHMPTAVLDAPGTGRRRSGGGMRSLRVRLTLVYAGMLAVLALILGVVLNVVVGAVLYRQEMESFRTAAQVTIQRQQTRLESLIQGDAIAGSGVAGTGCGTPQSYQQAFSDAIIKPLSYQPNFKSAYLLDYFGTVLVSGNDSTTLVGDTAPYFERRQLSALYAKVQGENASTLGYLADQSYTVGGVGGLFRPQFGVVLVAERFQTTSQCLRPNARPVLGVVEVVTNFSGVLAVLGTMRIVLALLVLAMLVVGTLVTWPLVSQGLKPLRVMTQTANRIASGDLSQRVSLPHDHGGDEIGQLASAFDEMATRIEAAFAAQASSEAHMRQFIADASHELRTPLTAIRGYADVLLRGAAEHDPRTAHEVLLAVQREAERMSRLVNDLLTLARLDAGRPLDLQPMDVIALTGEAVDQARILAGEREVSLHTDGGGRLTVRVDPDRMKQVILILLDNGLKYGRADPSGWVRVQVSRTAGDAVLTVSDNGQGIPPEDLPHIFDRFYRSERAKRQRRMSGAPASAAESQERAGATGGLHAAGAAHSSPSGVGLGLAIAHAIVRSHGGTLTVESQLGLGTRFTLALPRA
jgi:two-component system, OmpR family, sensor kinase